MKALTHHKSTAIYLRKQGLTYSQILSQIPVSQSSLSQWFKNISLTSTQQKLIQNNQKASSLRGLTTRHNQTLNKKMNVIKKAEEEIKHISSRELWLIGIALYWGEGSKQRLKSPSQGIRFTNSDPNMIRIFHLWLTKAIKVPVDKIQYEIYLHQSLIQEKIEIIRYWAKILRQPIEKFDRIYLKKNTIKKTYAQSDYKGVVRIVVKKSTNLNRQITGWQKGIVKICEIV